MNNEIKKIEKIKQVRLLQQVQYDIEKQLYNYLKLGNKIDIIESIIIDILKDKTNIKPNIQINYDEKTFNIIIKMDNVGLKILISNEDYNI
mgnify:CR=1 FL=1